MASEGKVDFRVKGNLGEIIIDHPPANALNRPTLGSFATAIETLNATESVRVIVITGKGEKFFAGGADINEFMALSQNTGEAFVGFVHEVFAKIHHSPKVVIAAINGFALGGGCELALACDIRIAAENAKLGQPEVNYSIIPAGGATQRLPRVVGLGRAKELIFTGDIIDAQEAFQMGLVNRVVPSHALMNEVHAIAEKISLKGPVAIRLAKEATNLATELPLSEGFKREIQLFGVACATEDKNEGAQAFLEKRQPNFKGK